MDLPLASQGCSAGLRDNSAVFKRRYDRTMDGPVNAQNCLKEAAVGTHAPTPGTTAESGLRAEVAEVFAQLDGSDASYVRVLTGMSYDQLRAARAI